MKGIEMSKNKELTELCTELYKRLIALEAYSFDMLRVYGISNAAYRVLNEVLGQIKFEPTEEWIPPTQEEFEKDMVNLCGIKKSDVVYSIAGSDWYEEEAERVYRS